MNLIEQHMENVAREEAHLEERLASFKAEQEETRKLLGNIRRYRKSLCKQYPSSQATLPLAPPPDDEEEEATDEVDFGSPSDGTGDGGGQWGAPEAEPLSPDGQYLGYEPPPPLSEDEMGPEEFDQAIAKEREPAPAEPEKLIRRRKVKATAEE